MAGMKFKTLPLALAFLPAFAAFSSAADYSKPQTECEKFVVENVPEEISSGDYLGEKRVVWRGERVNVPVILPAKNSVRAALIPENFSAGAKTLPVSAQLVRNVVALGGKVFPDIIEPDKTFSQPGEKQIFWLSCDVPADAKPGKYALALDGKKLADVEILAAVLPPPQKWRVHLDLWQHPEAVARWAGTPLWSEKHFKAMEPVMRRLAQAGQKTITCSIIDEPWRHQTWDAWSGMVKWKKKKSGKWEFDYSAFDKWVAFMMSLGIDKQISCYSMISWADTAPYFDESAGAEKRVKITPGNAEADEMWGIFLDDFRKHLRKKGWLEKTAIALDERPDAIVRATCELVRKHAPELKVVSAVDRPSKMSPFVDDISPVFHHSGGDVPALAKSRKKAGKTTTFYVCLNPAKPNTFAHSAAAEPHWLMLYAAANDFDGFLRWAYNSWTENPFKNTFHRARPAWAPTDCFLVYPGNRTTMRFERLRDGIEDFEKIQILRERAEKPGASAELKKSVSALNSFLAETFTVENGGGNAHAEQVKRARELVDAASATL